MVVLEFQGFGFPLVESPKRRRILKKDTNDLLIRGGFLRQAYSGVFHLLPLGLRVQEKLEKLIDKHMRSLGASKLSLSSLSSQELWERTGRLKEGSEVFRFNDRKDSRFLLAPTHEEEITTLVAGLVKSYKDLPLRVYQISINSPTARKYRDEARPRQGLLRGREFVMKDLYTFDYNTEEALKTYEAVRHAYMQLFNELKIPYLVAAADSGNMGGNLSHEFHIISSKGEDTVISCSHCNHVHNEEIADGQAHVSGSESSSGTGADPTTPGLGSHETPAISTGLWTAISKDRKTLIRGWYPKYLMQSDSAEPVEREVNSHAVKAITKAAGVDLESSIENPLELWFDELKRESKSTSTTRERRFRVLDVYDSQVRVYKRPPLSGLPEEIDTFKYDIEYSMLDRFPGTSNGLNLVRVIDGDKCPKCEHGTLRAQSAIELGHTFHLGTRYSGVLQASVAVERSMLYSSTDSASSHAGGTQLVPMQMGCHGIGVSRMISAVADVLSDSKGLNWPRAIAPYEVVVVPAKGLDAEAEKVYDILTSDNSAPIDAVLDDRDKQIGWKLGDADLIGYPVIVVVGKGWKQRQELEVQCRRLNGLREQVPIDRLSEFVRSLLDRL
ncbi:Proline--tRNA ligase [Rasamsonia emersonii CBS 393.64]|uniref:Proline--tRNA ligase n=1 Tax=Rasamsonia emersonii (strain ATCC 16479 / CBS 393.64 / IMI 116815) TaxID=1408163 RepID=A0A0F4YW46_RASE3|nr:Proline--tRNA ligase [Rasamsonia emersonii CBS 393.64]KKA22449.1 Proline--tRNA ligase [Rasamsonia emersonii CBS 393.64]